MNSIVIGACGSASLIHNVILSNLIIEGRSRWGYPTVNTLIGVTLTDPCLL